MPHNIPLVKFTGTRNATYNPIVHAIVTRDVNKAIIA